MEICENFTFKVIVKNNWLTFYGHVVYYHVCKITICYGINLLEQLTCASVLVD